MVHSERLLIIVFLAVVVQSLPQVVFISPDPETTPCPNESVPCMTLSQYASQSSDQIASETTLRFLPGDHPLNRVLDISNVISFTMLRDSNTSRAAMKISCQHYGRFEFHSIQSVHMSDLQLEGCYGNMVDSVTKFVLKNSLISGEGNTDYHSLCTASINLHSNTVSMITNSIFKNNRAHGRGTGSAVCVFSNNTVSITNCTFNNNSAINGGGGVMVFINNTVSITDSEFNNNRVDSLGAGGIYVLANNIVFITNCTFESNSGGSVHIDTNNTVEFRGTTNIKNNRGTESTLYILLSSVSFSGHTTIENNNGTIFAISSNISFNGKTKFYKNSQIHNSISQGGLITALKSNIFLTGNVEIMNNTADNGGAISVIQSYLYIYGNNIVIEHNYVRISGGGIYAYLSQVDISAMNCTISGNTAVEAGGGIHAVGSTVSLSKGGSLFIAENTANLGGGMCMELNAKLMLFTEDPVHGRNSLKFLHNVAQHNGGAIYVADNTLSGTCSETDSSSVIKECFFQAITFYQVTSNSHKDLVFFNNTAHKGRTLYGGLLDRCKISPFAEGYQKYKVAVGIDYFRDVANIDSGENLITSDPTRVCICNDNKPNCSIQSPKIQVQKGHNIKLFVVAVDQVEEPVSRDSDVIIHAYLSNAHQGSHMKDGQTSQHEYNGSCTQLHYNIFSEQSSEELVLYAEGPCKDEVGLSQLVISVDFLECTCQDSFIPLPSNDNCSCGCYPKLINPKRYIENCSSADSTLLRSGLAWINYIHNCTDYLSSTHCSSAGYVVNLYCPYDYCQSANKHVYINVSMPNGSDTQCAFNRSGKLCGSCESGLSHSLGSSQCMPCTNTWLALLLPFSLAGIALVVFILMLNLTVSTGTINGLIFYANIIAANRATFLQFNKPNILTVFIAWVNLDLGIETCFYNGMDAYAKVWLQIVFPAYIILLVFVIIVICTLSERFASLIGNKNPVATLATLFLLSYTKLLRVTIAAFNFTYLDHLNGGYKELVWLYDADVAYLRGKHTPLFVAAILIIVIGVIYTCLLLFWQWLQRCSNWTVLSWMNNTKLIALMDAYHAPYQQHRYWTGLLLLARVILYLVSALNYSGEPSVILLSVGCILAVLLFIKMVCTRSKIYKNWGTDTLDTLCLLNLLLYVIASLYLHAMNVIGSQVSLAYTSVSISFTIFLAILVYHLYTPFLKLCKMFLEKLRNTRTKKHRAYEDILSEEGSDDEEYASLRSELRDIITGPPNADDYRQLEAATRRARVMERRRGRANKREVTHTVVEIPQNQNSPYHYRSEAIPT